MSAQAQLQNPSGISIRSFTMYCLSKSTSGHSSSTFPSAYFWNTSSVFNFFNTVIFTLLIVKSFPPFFELQQVATDARLFNVVLLSVSQGALSPDEN